MPLLYELFLCFYEATSERATLHHSTPRRYLSQVLRLGIIQLMQRGGGAVRGYQVNRRRIGKKAMALSRTAILLERKIAAATPQKTVKRKVSPPLLSWRPRRVHYVILSAVLVIALIGTGGYIYYERQADAKRRVEEAAAQERARTASQKSNECREQKVAAKADQWGKVSFDQLYDYSVCDYSE